jgi:hypothetical protein
MTWSVTIIQLQSVRSEPLSNPLKEGRCTCRRTETWQAGSSARDGAYLQDKPQALLINSRWKHLKRNHL